MWSCCLLLCGPAFSLHFWVVLLTPPLPFLVWWCVPLLTPFGGAAFCFPRFTLCLCLLSGVIFSIPIMKTTTQKEASESSTAPKKDGTAAPSKAAPRAWTEEVKAAPPRRSMENHHLSESTTTKEEGEKTAQPKEREEKAAPPKMETQRHTKGGCDSITNQISTAQRRQRQGRNHFHPKGGGESTTAQKERCEGNNTILKEEDEEGK